MKPDFIELRNRKSDAAIIFVHGFSRDPETPWGSFPSFIMQEEKHLNWDIYSFGYPTSLMPDLKGIWSADPDLKTIADALRTRLSDTSLSDYKSYAIIAHSMGGLVVQRAILDLKKNSQEVFNEVSHLFLFGTPSKGLIKASWGGFLKKQLKDMGRNSDFIRCLREEWDALDIDHKYPFFFRTVAGQKDEFVPKDSSIYPFPEMNRKVAPGDHSSMVKPKSLKDVCVQIVINGLSENDTNSFWDSARVSVDKRNFKRIINEWEPHSSELDDNALVELALALDTVGKRDDAIKIIEARGKKTTDAMGALAGCYKRQWLYEGRRKNDAERAYDLYSEAYGIARENGDADQALYLGINVAFMQLLYKKDQVSAEDTAEKVLVYCEKKGEKVDKWSLATQGEVFLLKGSIESALKKYKEAIMPEYGANSREIATMYIQAKKIIEAKYNQEYIDRLDEIF